VDIHAIEETFKTISPEETEDVYSRPSKNKFELDNSKLLRSKSESLSEIILSIFVQNPLMLKKLVLENIEFFNFKYQDLLALIKTKGIEIINDQTIDPLIKEIIDDLYINNVKYEDLLKQKEEIILAEINNFIKLLKQEHYKNKINDIQVEIKNAENRNDSVRINELINELNTVCKIINKLNI